MISEEDREKQNLALSYGNKKRTLDKKVKKVAVIGAGTIGRSWATLFATKGCKVNLQDIKEKYLKESLRSIISDLELLRGSGLVNENPESILDRISLTTDLSLALKSVDYVQESVSESYQIKKEVFAQMDSICPENVILASSSSGLLMSEIQKATKRPQRCIIAHPFNPPHLMPLVELVPGKETSKEVLERAYQFYIALGKSPLRVKKEVPGHIANRLCAALWREAIDLVHDDVASVEDVDLAVRKGPGLRWALMGPHLSYHLGGGSGGIKEFIEHIGPAFETVWNSMNNWTSIPPSAVKKVVKGVEEEVGTKSPEYLRRWRDDRLLKVLDVVSDNHSST